MSNRSLLIAWRQRWNSSLLQFIGRRVRAAVDIEDLAQETYFQLLRARDLQGIHNPQAYLLRVASHVVAQWRDRQLPHFKVEALAEDLLVDERTPELDLTQRQVRRHLTRGFAQLRGALLD